ncbi:peptide-methionine (S)-S-oxide reductase MsrA [Alteraurantiacibacter aquimixticola]|uniref:Peptide methionine sulfoxide reductase MsrA n=1 Tax=Alteraurantiacibacter aquimixticola TaxID=2489173 RepID=A0A4V4U8A1_9SPHN|nr:peptide-methionine (S)-S-oxide reductase MsrA [Alteraurantiacibacter aquimixticola]TIX49057.1 peptide-methionine (S)-S-oxide reductase MsrA [Alteraurantiacibacter aquimixticola]
MTIRRKTIPSLFLAAALSAAAITTVPASAEEVFNAPVATRHANESGLQTAIFAGGCFWGIEAVFAHTRGVQSAVSGYHGGTQRQAEYRLVASGVTDHAEAVKVVYDPSVIRYDQLLQILFSVGADPTLLNRQGPDRGTQYRSAIVPLTAEQRTVAQSYLRQMGNSGVWDGNIVVAIENHRQFFPAEEYHQDFAFRNPNNAYIRRWDAPKVEALREMFPQFYRSTYRTG